jgi:hypothetical protein
MKLLSDYVAEVQKKISEEKDALGRGAAASYEDYTRRVGKIAGMASAVEILRELFKTTPAEERD